MDGECGHRTEHIPHPPGLLVRPSCDLNKQLEAFSDAQVFHAQRKVRINHSHERGVGKIQTLGDHLRANEDVDPPFSKIPQG